MVVAEFVAGTELGPGGDFGLVLGDEPECGASVGPESVHRFGLDAGAGVEDVFGAGAEAA